MPVTTDHVRKRLFLNINHYSPLNICRKLHFDKIVAFVPLRPRQTLTSDVKLQIDMPPGAKDCWVFMNCMEITQSLERLKSKNDDGVWRGGFEGGMNMSNIDLQLEIANLWNLARSKVIRVSFSI